MYLYHVKVHKKTRRTSLWFLNTLSSSQVIENGEKTNDVANSANRFNFVCLPAAGNFQLQTSLHGILFYSFTKKVQDSVVYFISSFQRNYDKLGCNTM